MICKICWKKEVTPSTMKKKKENNPMYTRITNIPAKSGIPEQWLQSLLIMLFES